MALNKVGSLWLRDGQKGKFMAGVININNQEIPIMVFKNDKGDNPKRPDYQIMQVDQDDQSNQNQERNQAPNQGYSNNQHPMSHGNQEPEQQPIPDDSSIPF